MIGLEGHSPERRIDTFTCNKCGAITEHSYDECDSYSSLFNSGEWVTVACRQCHAKVGEVKEY